MAAEKVLFDTTKDGRAVNEYVVTRPNGESFSIIDYGALIHTLKVLDKNGEAHVLYIVQKMGLGGSIIDNNCLFTPVDPETGKILYPAHSGDTLKGIIYEEHPDTHIKIQGYQIPFVKEAVQMVLEAAKVTPQIRYVGWDVATTPNGPAIIEGNTYCAHDFWQLPPHTPDGIGMLPTIKKYIPEFFEGKIK